MFPTCRTEWLSVFLLIHQGIRLEMSGMHFWLEILKIFCMATVLMESFLPKVDIIMIPLGYCWIHMLRFMSVKHVLVLTRKIFFVWSLVLSTLTLLVFPSKCIGNWNNFYYLGNHKERGVRRIGTRRQLLAANGLHGTIFRRRGT